MFADALQQRNSEDIGNQAVLGQREDYGFQGSNKVNEWGELAGTNPKKAKQFGFSPDKAKQPNRTASAVLTEHVTPPPQKDKISEGTPQSEEDMPKLEPSQCNGCKQWRDSDPSSQTLQGRVDSKDGQWY